MEFILKFTVLLLNVFYIMCEYKYYETFNTEVSQLNNVNSTVVISESKDIGECTCDLTPNACDYFCCCDPDCPEETLKAWKEDEKFVCRDRRNFENDYLTHCFNENFLYRFNRKRGMREYRDSLSKLFCVTFDNSSIMGKFYQDISKLQTSTINSIFQNYIDKHIKSYYYYEMNTGVALDTRYKFKDYLKVNALGSQDSYIFDKKFFLYESGPFGECVKTNPVRFLKQIPESSCGFKLKRFDQCAEKSWDTLINANYTFDNVPSNNPVPVEITVRSVLKRDHDNDQLIRAETTNLLSTTLTREENDNCVCDNLLESAHFTFVMAKTSMILRNVYVDLTLGFNVKASCSKKYVVKQSYSAKFLNNLDENLERSGAPGYVQGRNLLVAYKKTNEVTNKLEFVVPKAGFYMTGRDKDGNCVETPQTSIFKDVDIPIKYGVNTEFSCKKEMNLAEFKVFCNTRNYNNYALYKFHEKIQHIGIFGSADPTFEKDWTEVIFDYDLGKGLFYPTNNTCYFPQTIFLDVLVSKAGTISNPQTYVVAAKVSAKYEYVPFLSRDKGKRIPFAMRFIVNYVPLVADQLTATRMTPTILPGLPQDIANPFA